MSFRLVPVLLLFALCAGCPAPEVPLEDGGAQDAGTDASGDDAGGGDAGILPPHDAGLPDASEPDAGPPSDAGTTDAGFPEDAGVPCGIADDGSWPLTDGGYCFRVMAANTTSGNYQTYEEPGLRIFEGLAPDIVLIQEFGYRGGTARELADQAMSSDACFYREPQVGGIPNGVISRFPIIEAGEWADPTVSDRDYAWARIDLPGPKDLWVVSLHLVTSPAGDRQAQAAEVVNRIQTELDTSGGYLIVGGDLNTTTRTEGAVTQLSQVVVTSPPYPVDQAGNGNTNANRTRPYDWVLASPDLHAREAPLVLGTQSFPGGLVFDSRVFTPLSDVDPVRLTDSGATNMQHMAVMRVFCVDP